MPVVSYQSNYYTRISCVLLLALFLAYAIYSLLLAFSPGLYHVLSREDGAAEYSGAFAFLACGIVLFLAAKKKYTDIFSKVLLYIFALFFVIAAGEEISWGQRIIGWSTPDQLAAINDQNETNFHNINKKFFDRLYDRGAFVLCFISYVLVYFNRRYVVAKIAPPSLLLVFCLSSIFYYQQIESIEKFDEHYVVYLIAIVLFLFLFVRKQQYMMFSMTAFISMVMLFLLLTNLCLYDNFPQANFNNSANEIRESLFAYCCLAYGCEIFFKRPA